LRRLGLSFWSDAVRIANDAVDGLIVVALQKTTTYPE
jgi:hypothetical protein